MTAEWQGLWLCTQRLSDYASQSALVAEAL
jgi:hypothetical protein